MNHHLTPFHCIDVVLRRGKLTTRRNGWHLLKTETVAVSSSPSLWVFKSHFETRKKQGPGETPGGNGQPVDLGLDEDAQTVCFRRHELEKACTADPLRHSWTCLLPPAPAFLPTPTCGNL